MWEEGCRDVPYGLTQQVCRPDHKQQVATSRGHPGTVGFINGQKVGPESKMTDCFLF